MSTNQNKYQKSSYFMRLALQQAARSLGNTRQNPAVGCVIVKNNHLISAGYIIITKAQLGGTDLGTVIAYAGPGVVLTIVTQILWFGDKNKLREQGQEVDSPTLISGAIRSGNSRRRRSKKKRR